MSFMKQKRIYLDYASTTPLDPRVLEAMLPWFGASFPNQLTKQPTNQATSFGNPGSLHSFGQAASAAVFKPRQTIAGAIGAHYSEIIFTGSATEANNLALRGSVKQMMNDQLRMKNGKFIPRLIISAIEHESVLETARDLEKDGVDVVLIPVSREGIVDLKKLKAALNERTVLVSVMYANNEVGTVQPIAEIAKIVNDFRASQPTNQLTKQPSNYPLLHVDAVQAFQYLDCNVDALGVDLMTLSAHKIYGPKGIGCLYARRVPASKLLTTHYSLLTILTGGGQEFGLRSGTENVSAIVGFAKAVEIASALRSKEFQRIAKLRDKLFKGNKIIFPGVVLNGGAQGRLPNNLNIFIPRRSGEQLLVALDLAGIAVSSGSACSARSIDPSHVLLAMGFDRTRAKNSIRFSLGRLTTDAEIDRVLTVLSSIKQ